ncbi:MAG: hypothetical protein ABL993_04000 [Vicinamibacterales bacterium]
MNEYLPLGAILYIGGVLTGLVLGDGPLAGRVGLALAWPLGPLAFMLTVALLVGAACIAFPAFGAAVVAAALAFWAYQ